MQRPAAASHNATSIACCLLTALILACGSESTAPELYVPTDWRAIAAGSAHACAVTTSGAAYCWGFGGDGQFGNGSTTDSADSPIPVAVSGGLSFTALAGGDGHTCGLTTSGAAYCWGSNSFGQLGDGSTKDSYIPADV